MTDRPTADLNSRHISIYNRSRHSLHLMMKHRLYISVHLFIPLFLAGFTIRSISVLPFTLFLPCYVFFFLYFYTIVSDFCCAAD